MKIALLNLKYDNNYGGNLQRYALMKVLQDMGHDVTHLNLRFNYHRPWYKLLLSLLKIIVKKYFLGKDVIIPQWQQAQHTYEDLCSITEPFYKKYVKHTEQITDLRKLSEFNEFDAYVVGSDQVWRKRIAGGYIKTMFLDFLPENTKSKRIAYGVSLGVAENELCNEEIKQLSDLYQRFDAVSVREDSALDMFKQYGWNKPQAIQVLDPTLLLCKEDYMKLIENGKTTQSDGNLFCYILDKTHEKCTLISEKAEVLHLKPFEVGLNKPVSIEQWLRSFSDSEYVITDSYHGLVFSIIFNKPFFLIRNEFRGNARFDSVIRMFGIQDDCSDNLNWNLVNKIIADNRKKSFRFLANALNIQDN
ncbi:polysaccharide pyruvyl transferase family protein [Xylanibacter brevis]|uniref:polysaccharide pyruvyl transferase family protein n=1 Tax=Xylanibacter brevis TaxID=83231 RepID=UPI000481D7DE|nr:polysaccharide pyruvyl transferase family protein [Xylanibacter brevis]